MGLVISQLGDLMSSAAASVVGSVPLATDTSGASDWSPAAAALLPGILPATGVLLSYGGSRQLQSGGTVTHGGALHVSGIVKATGSGLGSVQLSPGGNPQVGLVEWLQPNGARTAYMGYNGDANLTLGFDQGGALTIGGAVHGPNTGDTGPWLRGAFTTSGIGVQDDRTTIWRYGTRIFSAGGEGICAYNVSPIGLSRTQTPMVYLYCEGDSMIGLTNPDGVTYGTLNTAVVAHPSAALTVGNTAHGVAVPGTLTVGGATTQNLLINRNTGGGSLTWGAHIQYAGATKAGIDAHVGTGEVRIGGLAASYFPVLYSNGNACLSFDTAGATTFTGNVTTGPKITVNQTGVNGTAFQVNNDYGGFRFESGGGSLMYLQSASGGHAGLHVRTVQTTDYLMTERLIFPTGGRITPITDGVRVMNAGQSADGAVQAGAAALSGAVAVGGTHTPIKQLDVRGTGDIYLRSAAPLVHFYETSNGRQSYFWMNSSGHMLFGNFSGSLWKEPVKFEYGAGNGLLTVNSQSHVLVGTPTDDGSGALFQVAGNSTFRGVVSLASNYQDMVDGVNLVTGVTTGSQIGTGATQKLAFWGATPIVRPASANQAALALDTDVTGGDTVDLAAVNSNFSSVQTLVNQLRADLVAAGLIKGTA